VHESAHDPQAPQQDGYSRSRLLGQWHVEQACAKNPGGADVEGGCTYSLVLHQVQREGIRRQAMEDVSTVQVPTTGPDCRPEEPPLTLQSSGLASRTPSPPQTEAFTS
jgi:hypothetical protein